LGHVAHTGEMRQACNVLVGKPKWIKLLRRPRHRWKDSIRTDHREIGWEGVDWMHVP